MSLETEARAFKRAVNLVGGYTAAGEIMGCSRQNVQQLVTGGRPCPPSGVRKLSAASGVPKSELAPSLYDPEEDERPARAAAG